MTGQEADTSDGAVRYLIIDLDGTLVDSCAGIVGIINDMLEERGSVRRIDTAFARAHMSGGGGYLVSTLLGEDGVDSGDDLADFRARYQGRPTLPDALYHGVAAGLATLHDQGYRLAICSNKPRHLCEKVLADTGLTRFFDVIVGGEDGIRPKPAADMVEAAIARLGATAAQCLYIGDSDVDHDAARAAGVPFHFVSYGYAAEGWTPSRGEPFDRFADVVAAIAESSASHA